MKRKFLPLFILFTMFGTSQIFAQSKSKPKEVVVIKFMIPNRNEYDRVEVPIDKIFSEDNGIGGGSVSECLDYTKDRERCRNIYSSYDFTASSIRINKIKSRVVFNIEVTDGCKTRKVFNVSRNRRTKIRIGCGVNLIAYYGTESKEAN